MNKIGLDVPSTFVYDEVEGTIKKYVCPFRDTDYYETVLSETNLNMKHVFALLHDAYNEGVSYGSSNVRNQIKVALGIPSS